MFYVKLNTFYPDRYGTLTGFRVNSTHGHLDTCRVDSCDELTSVNSTHGQLDTYESTHVKKY